MAMSAFRRSAAQETKNRGGKGGKSSYYEKMRLPKVEATPIVILRGEWVDPKPPKELEEIDPTTGRPKPAILDYYKYLVHKRKFMENGNEAYRDEPCSKGYDDHNPQPCAGCMAIDSGDKSIKLTDAYVFSIVHLIPYHTHPLIDWRTKQIMMKKDNSGPVMTFAECQGRLCNFCRVQQGQQPIVQQNGPQWDGWQANQITTSFGHRRYLEIGKSHLSNLEGFDNIVSSMCGTCRNPLTVEGYACGTCDTLLIDMQYETRSNEQIQDAISKAYPCLTCNRQVLLMESAYCQSCEASGRQFRQDSLFSSVLYLFRQGEGTKSQIMMQRSQPLDELGQILAQQGWLQNGKTIHQLIEEIGKPYDFAEIFKPRNIEEQRKKLGYGGGQQQGQQQGYGAYGQQPQYGGQPQGYQSQPQQQQMGYPPQQQQQFMPPPQQPGYTQYPPQPQGYVQPGPNTAGQPSNNVGPAPFQPIGRPNFGS